MRKRDLLLNCFIVALFHCFMVVGPVLAQARTPKISPQPSIATSSAEATPSAKEVIKKPEVVEKKQDITESSPEIKGKLERYLVDHPVGPLNVANFLQHSIRAAVQKGVSANTIVLILLFPLVAAIIAGSRHVIGVRGFGIFLPAVISVVFVATGIIEGLILFFTIILVANIARMISRKAKLQYLPRMALLLWFVALAVLGLMFLSPLLNLSALINLSIFPVLILILLTENFMSIQAGMSQKQAVRMTFETLVMALICSVVLQLNFLQKFVLLNPEISVLGVGLLDVFMGKYSGLRLLEYKKFKEILK